MKGSAALAVLKVEVGIDPLHKYFEEVEGGKFHEEMLYSPFFIVLKLFVHFWFGYNEFGI